MGYYYTVYNNITEEIVAAGTSKECAKTMGRSVNAFHSMVAKTRHGKNHLYTIIIERPDGRESTVSCNSEVFDCEAEE